MAKKFNKVFLNPTAEQIAEYELVKGTTWFTEMDAIAAAIEADQKKQKASERIYSLNNFQIVDGAHQITANLSKIAKQTGYTLSNDLNKVIDWAKTEIDYDVDSTTDHRVASTAAEGTATLSEQARGVNPPVTIKRSDSPHGATTEGEKEYKDAIEAAKKAFDDANAPADTTIIGYKDLSLTNIGSKATEEEEKADSYKERKTIVTQYATTNVKGGDFSFDYQMDSTKEIDKKDPDLLTESGKLNVKISAAASGTLTVKDSVINDVTDSFSESAGSIKGLHANEDVSDYVDETAAGAGAYESVVIDNSTVGGDIKGGSISIEESGTFTKETFLDKAAESGTYYNSVTDGDQGSAASNNSKLYIHVADKSALTEDEVKALQKEGYEVGGESAQANLIVNKYQILTFDVNGDEIKTGSFVYLTETEYNNLSAGHKKALDLAPEDANVGYVDYSPKRVVTDANYLTYSTAPTGAAASKNIVNKYVFEKGGDKVTYYLTAGELAGAVGTDIQTTKGYALIETDAGNYRRIAKDVKVDDYTAKATSGNVYHIYSDTYKQYAVSATISEEAALELNKTDMANGFVWVKGAASNEKSLFCMSQFKIEGGKSVEYKYYLTAGEMSAMGFFGEGVTKSYAAVVALDANDLTKEGWAFTGNKAGAARVYKNPADADKNMYREGAAATEATLSKYTTDKTDVVTDVKPNAYSRKVISYTTASAGSLKQVMEDVGAAAQFSELVSNDLVGENGEYVTVIDGKAVDMYQTFGYAATVTDPATVVAGKLSTNAAEIKYSAVIQESLWDGDKKITAKNATLVDGVRTQNTKKYFDQYADADGEYVKATAAEEKSGEKVHEFITVAEMRKRSNNEDILSDENVGELVTDVQATTEVDGKYVAAYFDHYTGAVTNKEKVTDENLSVNYYAKNYGLETQKIYALTSAEATAAADGGDIDDTTKLKYFTSGHNGGWFEKASDAATAWTVQEKDVKEVKQPKYRDYQVTTALVTADINNALYTTLTQAGKLTSELNWINEKVYVTEEIYFAKDGALDGNTARLQVDGKDAYYEKVSGTLVTSATSTYDAIYTWELRKAGSSIDGLTYYMTENEKKKIVLPDGIVEGAAFVQIAGPIVDDDKRQYRISKTGTDKNAYLTWDPKETYKVANSGPVETDIPLENKAAYNHITYVVGDQVYKYTLEGDATTYYLTEKEATEKIGDTWGGKLTKGDKVEGSVHYGYAKPADYSAEKKENFTKSGTVYYFTDSYTDDCISQDAEGKAIQAKNADGEEIWSNVSGVKWTADNVGEQVYKYTIEGDPAVYYLTKTEAALIGDTWGGDLIQGDLDEGAYHYGKAASYAAGVKGNFTVQGTVYYADTKYSTAASELCDNTYFYNYDDPKKWSAEQITNISAAEEAAGIATWKADNINGQIVWTRTTPIGEVSTYVMDYETVDTAYNQKGNTTRTATGSLKVINGSDVRGTISGYKDVLVTDSTVKDVDGGDYSSLSTETLATSKGSIGKDGSQTIATKETEDSADSRTAAGSFTISRTNSDKIYNDAGNVSGYETVEITGVNTGNVKANKQIHAGAEDNGSNYTKLSSRTTQISYQGDADALRSNYVDNWDDLAFTKGIVSKVTAETENTKEVYASTGSFKATGRDYTYVPGDGKDKANTIGSVEGYTDVTLNNINAANITAIDRTEDTQTTYKLTTKGNVDTAAETEKSNSQKKAVAELTAVNSVTNPELEADLTIGNIDGFAKVSTVNYSFVDANALGEVVKSTTKSSSRDAVASDMRLLNAGVNKNTGDLDQPATQKYAYGNTKAANVGTHTYANKDMGYTEATTTKRTATGELTATGRSYKVVKENLVDKQNGAVRKPVYAYTQAVTNRTYYLDEDQFKALLTESKADAAQWTKGTEVVYYRSSDKPVVTTYAGVVTGAQVVYDYTNGVVHRFMTEGEASAYNDFAKDQDPALPLMEKAPEAKAWLRQTGQPKADFTYNIGNVSSTGANKDKIGVIAGVFCYTKAGEDDQYLTVEEATALGEGWSKGGEEFVRLASAGEDRSADSAMARASMTADLKVYVNKYDSSDFFIVNANEENFLQKVAAEMDNYALANTTGYRKKVALGGPTAGIGISNFDGVGKINDNADANWAFMEYHSYVKWNDFDEITEQAYVSDADFAKMSKEGKALDGYKLDDGSHKLNGHSAVLTKLVVRQANLNVTEDTTVGTINTATTVLDNNELIGLKLTDDQVEKTKLYTSGNPLDPLNGKLSEFVLSAVTEDPTPGNTTFANIYGYKTVALSGMEGGDIIRVANEWGDVDADTDTTNKTYKKTIKKGKDGAVTYTENDTRKTTQTYTADGSVELVDSKVGNIAGYKDVSVTTENGTVQVGLISRTTPDELDGSLDKFTEDRKTKVDTVDSAATFKVTESQQIKTTEARTATGSVELIGKRAGKEITIDKSVLYDTKEKAEAAARAAMDAWDGKQFADLQITGGVIGYQDVTIENASITDSDVVFVGGKNTVNRSTDHTTVHITDNAGETVTVINKINDSTIVNKAAAGSLTMTNVNYAGDYTESYEVVAEWEENDDPPPAKYYYYDKDVYTLANEYVFNGATYALTEAEAAALLKYGELKAKSSTPGDNYVDVFRKNDTITTPAVELIGSLQDVVNAKGVKAADVNHNTVYFAASTKQGDLYIRDDQVNDLVAGKGAYSAYTDVKVDTTKEHYEKDTGLPSPEKYTKADWTDNKIEKAADVKKYVVTEDGKSTTYYLTDAEFNVMKNIEGMDIAAASDTEAKTRLEADLGPDAAVTVNALGIAAKQDAVISDVFEYRGVRTDDGNKGVSVSYYLTADEADEFLTGAKYKNFAKVGTKTYYRYTDVDVTSANFTEKATKNSIYTEVKNYEKDGDHIYLTAEEAKWIKGIDPTYEGYEQVGDTKYYRQAASAFNVVSSDDLKRYFTSVNESVEVFELQNLNDETLGYLSRAEILALRAANEKFDEYYKVIEGPGTKYYRAADDTTNIVKINAFKEGDGYLITEDLPFAQYTAAVDENVPGTWATARGYLTVSLTNADMGDIEGGTHTTKNTEKLAAKKTSSIATYTTTADTTDTSVGSLTATDSAIGDATWYDKVSLTASEMDEVNNRAGNIKGGKEISSVKTIYTSLVQEHKGDYVGNALEYTQTTKETKTASGSAELKNVVVAGNISGYKDVTVSFDKKIDDEAPEKNMIGGIKGGNSVTNTKKQVGKTNALGNSYGETVTKETLTSVGLVTLDNVYADGNVENFQGALVTESEITGVLSGGNIIVDTTEVDVDNSDPASSSAVVKTVTAAGKATVDASKVGGIAQFKDVELTGGVEVGNEGIIVGGDYEETVMRSNKDYANTPCYAVFYNDGDKKVVYLTEAEYKVFVQDVTTAMIDTTVAVYRQEKARTDEELKAVDIIDTLKGFTAYTDDPVTDTGMGQEGRNTTTWVVKTAGNSLTIDEDGAKVGGKVSGYASVLVSGASSFKKGYFGTDKNDKLVVDASLATFTTVPLGGGNPVGFDFGAGKDELALNGTIGIEAAFKYDAVTGTNAWNLETISGDGTIVCREEDVKSVKSAFDGITVVGSENYNAVNALGHQEFDDALEVEDTNSISDWIGFCNKDDYFENKTGAAKHLTFTGDSVKSGDIVAQVSIDGGVNWQSLKSGDEVAKGAFVRISQLSSSKKVSNDYTIAFK